MKDRPRIRTWQPRSAPESKGSSSSRPTAPSKPLWGFRGSSSDKRAPLREAVEDKQQVEEEPAEVSSEPIDSLESAPLHKPYRRVLAHKRRDKTKSVALSQEEYDAINKYLADQKRSFSEFARSCIFRAMGRKVPSRQTRAQAASKPKTRRKLRDPEQ